MNATTVETPEALEQMSKLIMQAIEARDAGAREYDSWAGAIEYDSWAPAA
jgi:hypothetical protein